VTAGWPVVTLAGRFNVIMRPRPSAAADKSSDDSLTSGRVGLACWDTKVRFRNIRIHDTKGKLLWTGLPVLPE